MDPGMQTCQDGEGDVVSSHSLLDIPLAARLGPKRSLQMAYASIECGLFAVLGNAT